MLIMLRGGGRMPDICGVVGMAVAGRWLTACPMTNDEIAGDEIAAAASSSSASASSAAMRLTRSSPAKPSAKLILAAPPPTLTLKRACSAPYADKRAAAVCRPGAAAAPLPSPKDARALSTP